MADDLKYFNALDARLGFELKEEQSKQWGIVRGPSNSNVIRYNANSFGNASLRWTFNTQSESTVMERKMYVEAVYQASITATNNTGSAIRILMPGQFAIRSFPISRCTSNIRLSLNNASMSVQAHDVVDCLTRYSADFDVNEYDMSGCPTALDVYQAYADGAASNRNPLADYKNSPLAGRSGRGGMCIITVSNPLIADAATGTATITFRVREPVFASPLGYKSCDQDEGFIGISHAGVEYSLDNLARMISMAERNNVAIDSTSCSLLTAGAHSMIPALHVGYISPPDSLQVPQFIRYNYSEMQVFNNNLGVAVPSGGSVSRTINSIQLKTVPKALYIWASIPTNEKGALTPDVYFRIDSLSLSYLNNSGQMSGLDTFDLFCMSRKNGLDMTFEEFNGQTFDVSGDGAAVPLCGSVVKVDAVDLALSELYASGMNVGSQLQFNIQVTNTAAVQRNLQIIVMTENEGLFVINTANGDCQSVIGVIDASDTVQTRATGDSEPYLPIASDLVGGSWKSFWRGVKHFFTSPKTWKTVGSIAKAAAPVLLAAGETEGGRLQKRKGKGKGSGGSLVGGKDMSKADLKRLLMS